MRTEFFDTIDGRKVPYFVAETAAERAYLSRLPRAEAGIGPANDHAPPDLLMEDDFVEDASCGRDDRITIGSGKLNDCELRPTVGRRPYRQKRRLMRRRPKGCGLRSPLTKK